MFIIFIIILAIGLESCPEPQIPNYGIRQGDRFMVGDVVQFSCEQGYSLQVKMNVCLCISLCWFIYSMPNTRHAHMHYLSVWADCQTWMQNLFFDAPLFFCFVCTKQQLSKVNQKETQLSGAFSLLAKHTSLVWFTQVLNNGCICCGLSNFCAECCSVLVQRWLSHAKHTHSLNIVFIWMYS